MKTTLLIFLMPLGLALAGDTTMTGWISDSACGTSNAGAAQAQRDCAKRCLDSGENAVFVSDGDQKVYKLTGAPDAKDHVKTKVRVSGTIDGDTLKVSKLEDVAQ